MYTAGDIATRKQTIVIDREGAGIRTAMNRLKDADRTYAYIVGENLEYHGVVSVDTLREAHEKGETKISAAYMADVEPIPADTSVSELIGIVARTPCGVPVICEKGRYLGVISKAALLETLDRQGDELDG